MTDLARILPWYASAVLFVTLILGALWAPRAIDAACGVILADPYPVTAFDQDTRHGTDVEIACQLISMTGSNVRPQGFSGMAVGDVR